MSPAEQQLAALEQHFPDSVLILLNMDGELLAANRNAHQLLDLAAGATIFEAIEQDDIDTLSSAISAVAASREPHCRIDISVRRMQGPSTRLLGWITPAGEVQTDAVLLSGHDLTALHEEAARFREITEGGVEGVVVHRDGLILYFNRRLAELIGLSNPEDLAVASEIGQFIHPEDRAMVAANVEGRLAGKDVPRDYEFRLLTVDGKTVWVDCRASVIMWDGRPAVVAALFDITEAKKAEKAREESENLFRLIFDLSPNVISLSRVSDGTVRFVNETFLSEMRYEEKDVVGKTAIELGLWSSETPRSKFLKAMKEHGTVRDQIARVVRSDGTTFDASISGKALTFQGEEYMLLVGNDVTEQNRQRRELHESKRAAEIANRAKSEFLANISHELRTPLNAIIGFAELIRSEALGPIGNEQYREYNGDILEAGRHLLTIINDILDLSKLEAGRLTIDSVEVELARLIESGVRLISERASSADLTMDVKSPDKDLAVLGDPIRLKQVLINLLSNAIKFTPPGGRVEVGTEQSDKKGICFYVTDTGVGMTEEDIEKALTPFEQIESSLTRRNVGTGLGLPLVNALVRLHGGEFELDTAAGKGTTARVWLPVADKSVSSEE